MADKAVSEVVSDQIRVQVYYRVDLEVGRPVRALLHRWVAARFKFAIDDRVSWVMIQIRQQANEQE